MKIGQLARKLKKHHVKSRSWQKTAEAFNMKKATAYRIAISDYDPADPDWRAAHGLDPRICPNCQRKITRPRAYKPKPISKQPTSELLWRLENREGINV